MFHAFISACKLGLFDLHWPYFWHACIFCVCKQLFCLRCGRVRLSSFNIPFSVSVSLHIWLMGV
ncbi:hypothetical protein RND81_03G149000 [Saponaria officinalis]|uniref:Uncharacterized protein n=1 Tax=Saponaria officinalis TaxID=3572 RepID=A0AAW1M994_SAPOF